MNDQRPDPGDGGTLVDHGIETIGASRAWFEQRIQERVGQLHGSSRLKGALRALQEIERNVLTGDTLKFSSPEAAQRSCLDWMGADFLTKALHLGDSGLSGFEKHWSSLKAGDPILTGPLVADLSTTRDRDFTWELLVASIAATFAANVCRGEPDVICEFGGQRIGLAAKMIYGSNDGQFLDVIQEGARQIQRQDIDGGFVVVNMVEQFPHARMFRNFRDARISDPRATYQLVAWWLDAFMVAHDVGEWVSHLKGMSKLMSVIMFVPTVLHLEGMPMPIPYYRLHTFGIIGREEQANMFEVAFQHACETRIPSFCFKSAA